MPQTNTLPYAQWLAQFAAIWRQGEHVALIGPTGSGKTFVSSDVLSIRDYVLVLAIKPHDDTLSRFTRHEPKYKRTSRWPIDYDVNRALLVFKPDYLGDRKQASNVRRVLNGVTKVGGWTILLDDVAYIINTLGLRREAVEFMNVGRSNGVTIVSALQQPSSVSGAVPSELKKQTKHTLIWKFSGVDEIESCARITGVDKNELMRLMGELSYYDNGVDRYSDFLYIRRAYAPVIVRVG